MELLIARVVTWAFHPVIMPTLGLYLIFQLNTFIRYTVSPDAQSFIYNVVFLNTFIIPVFIVSFLLWKNHIGSLEMQSRKERIFPFMAITVFYFFTWFLLRQFVFPQPVFSFLLGAAIAVLISMLLNFKWKISIHMVGIGGLAGAIYGISRMLTVDALGFLLPLIFIAGLIGFARMKEGDHRPYEIYTGLLIGALSEYLCIYYRIG